jgi:hypothetical protein
VGDDLLRERPLELPLDDPVTLDQVRQVGCGRMAREAEVPAGLSWVEDPAPARALHVAFLQYGPSVAA